MFAPTTGSAAMHAAQVAPLQMLAMSTESQQQQQQQPIGDPRRERIHMHEVSLNVLDDRPAIATGSLRPRIRGTSVSLQLLFGRRWLTVATARTGIHGRFKLRYTPHRLGSWRAQIRYSGLPGARGAIRRLGQLSSFRATDASWYGGGGGLACGGQLTSETMGVANKTLPCGTWLTLRYRDRSVRVQVIDRGPYVEGREFDLTEATKDVLGFEGVGVVWATR